MPADLGSSPPLPDPEAKESLGVVYADGRQTEDISLYELHPESEELFMSAYDLARIFKATKYWNPGARKLQLRIDAYRYLFTVDTRVVIVDEEPILLRVPVKYENGAVMIPLEFVAGVLAPRSFGQVELDEKLLVLTIGSPDYNVTGIAFEEGEEGSRAVLTLEEELLYHVDSDTPGLLRLKVYGGRLNPLKFSGVEGRGLFSRVRAEQTERDSYLFFEVKKTAERFRVEFEPPDGEEGRGRRLVIFLEEGKLPEIPDVDYAGKRMLEILDDRSQAAGRGPIEVVVVDPGHGGIDNGKISRNGVREKDVNLEIALMLQQELASQLGIEVAMTRAGDALVPFDSRAETANSAEGDLFLSIHCNGWFHPDAGGFETFFLSPARTEDEARLAREENASIRFENAGLRPEELEDLDFILWDMVQNEFINESSKFAEITQKELDRRLDIRNRGVKQAGFRVLRGLQMPAILIEIAFLSNPEEEQLLLDPIFRRDVVLGIVEAVRKYRDRFAAASMGG